MKKFPEGSTTDDPLSRAVLYADADIIVVNKPAGLSSQPDDKGGLSALEWLEQQFGQSLFVVHRLDRVATGVLVLARHAQAAAHLSAQFQQHQTEKLYLAVVSEKPLESTAKVVHFIKKNTLLNKAFVAEKTDKLAKKAELSYVLRGSSAFYHLLEVRLDTGRFHQIRCQLAALGLPIKGDVKYGAKRGNKDRSIHLHAWQLVCQHPKTGAAMCFVAPLPTEALWQAFQKETALTPLLSAITP